MLTECGHRLLEIADGSEDLVQSAPAGSLASMGQAGPFDNMDDELVAAIENGETLLDMSQSVEAGEFVNAEQSEETAAAQRRWAVDMDNIENLLSQTQTFAVTEDDSKDFEDLCMQSYEHSLTEAGMDTDAKQASLRAAALTGDFDVQGGLIGNMWARPPKSNQYKQQSLQAFFKGLLKLSLTRPHKALRGLARPRRAL